MYISKLLLNFTKQLMCLSCVCVCVHVYSNYTAAYNYLTLCDLTQSFYCAHQFYGLQVLTVDDGNGLSLL